MATKLAKKIPTNMSMDFFASYFSLDDIVTSSSDVTSLSVLKCVPFLTTFSAT